ncbi:MAG: class I SAM-dependent methyltransferase [Chloroflexota bacterium]|nr:class I SAM-dependent methyltransferase [Chloroflexota bacterium]
MADLPFTPAAPELAARLDACLDIEEKIPRALEALGPVGDRDVLLVDGEGGRRAGQLAELGARVRSLPLTAPGEALAAADGSADVVVGLWSSFRAPSVSELAEADRVLRPGGRLLVVQDYGRDDVSRLRGDLPEYGAWSRRDGWYLTNGFRIRVIHCFWTFESIDEARAFLGDAFGEAGARVGETLKRSRLSYNVAVYHRTRGGAEPRA